MEAITKIVPFQVGTFADENPLNHSHTKFLKLPREQVEIAAKNAIKEAKDFVSIHVKKHPIVN